MKNMKLLNIGCGHIVHPDWINLDVRRGKNVKYHNIKQRLPYGDNTIAAIYHSHVLEHLTKVEAAKFTLDCYRVLQAGGIMRVVVPDLEKICREYLQNLEKGYSDNDQAARQHYLWNKIEIFDQIVRQQPGGEMVEAVRSGEIDKDYINKRMGAELVSLYGQQESSAKKLAKSVYYFIAGRNPQISGEAHRWMYDRLDLKLLLTASGFKNFTIADYNHSAIPGWEKYNFDQAKSGDFARKPDSLFVEVEK